MGTPRGKKQNDRPELELSVAEKERLFVAARKIRKQLNPAVLAEILEQVRAILLPLVPWLDMPVFSESGIYRTPPFPEMWRKKRAMMVLDGSYISGQLDLMLERSGSWYVKMRLACDGGRPGYFEANSSGLAVQIIKRSDLLLRFSSSPTSEQLAGTLAFLRNIALYHSAAEMVARCFKTIDRTLREREERMRLMRERLQLLGDFPEMLDPLLADGKMVSVPTFAIFSNYRDTSSRHTGTYLTQECLRPFWDEIRTRTNPESYTPFNSLYNFHSLGEFLQRVRSEVEEIAEAKRQGRKDVTSLTSRADGRLPFSKEELKVLQGAVRSISEP
ncbi:MAG: hypothetical protein UY81_C0004G0004 [Candidatus Giovannonibacteria bacterium GW2011_GWA2_53_7]|uniref:Uncharacterized protein n=1 Tax=Candidatus Giovannonibacteria bacterium GW2011_GWA2_53_7 TaxID=1618650 RepID=A0A0G1Y1P5_9BACT|nr:MAG: hypothetical protein UY81_C0004G0004 [Candidatus Giovannonibacteria bacterium GW2011_GWA2_53_7]